MKALRILLGVCALSGLAGAQAPQKPFVYRGNGYGFMNLGACIHGYGFVGGGGGGEVLVYKGLAVGGEGSYNTFSDSWQIGIVTGQVGYRSSPAASVAPSAGTANEWGAPETSVAVARTGSKSGLACASKGAHCMCTRANSFLWVGSESRSADGYFTQRKPRSSSAMFCRVITGTRRSGAPSVAHGEIFGQLIQLPPRKV